MTVEFGGDEVVTTVFKFEREEGLVGIGQQAQEYLVAFPEGEVEELLFVNPCQFAFVTGSLLTAPRGSGEEVHVFARPHVADEGDDAPIAPGEDGEAGFFLDFAKHTFVRTFVSLAFAAYTNPFVMAGIVFFLDAVEHQILVVAFEIAEGGLFHLFLLVCLVAYHS